LTADLQHPQLLQLGAREKERTMRDFRLSIPLKVHIGDVNYSGHVGYQIYLSYFQEARIAYLKEFGCTELDIHGYGMIISEANCKYIQELFYRDEIRVKCGIGQLKSRVFVMEYRIEKGDDVCAIGSTTNLCYDYQKKKVVKLPSEFVKAIRKYERLD
jgi:acyl-CoA thioester hydrolase